MAKTVRKMYKLDRSNYNKISVNVKNVLPDGNGGGSAGAPGTGGAAVVNNIPPQVVQQAIAQGPTDNPVQIKPEYIGNDGTPSEAGDSSADSVQSYYPTPDPTPLAISIPSPTDNNFHSQFPYTPAESDSISFAPSSALPTPQPAGIGRLPSPPPAVVSTDSPGGVAAMQIDELVHSAPGMSEREIRNDLSAILAPFAQMLQKIELSRSTEAAEAARERAQMFERVVNAHAEQNARVGRAMEHMMRNVHDTFDTMPALVPQVAPLPTPMLALPPALPSPAPHSMQHSARSRSSYHWEAPPLTPMAETSLFNLGTLPAEAPISSYNWGHPRQPQGPYSWGQVPVNPLDFVPVPSVRRRRSGGAQEMKGGRTSPLAIELPPAEAAPIAVEEAVAEPEEEEATPVPTMSIRGDQMVPFAGPVTPKLQLDPALEAIRNAILNRTSAPITFASNETDPLAELINRTNNKQTFAIVRKEGKEVPHVPIAKLIKRLETVIRASEASDDQTTLLKALGYIDGLNRGIFTPAAVQEDTNKMFRNLRTVTRRDAMKSHATQEVLRHKRATKAGEIRAKRLSEMMKARRERDPDL